MRIVAFGSSHSVGYKLNDVADKSYNTLSEFSYPKIVAKHFECECINLAKCGNSIAQIYTDVFSFMSESRDEDVIIIQIPLNTAWFKLITNKNESVNILGPNSLNDKGTRVKNALEELYATLTNDNHWNYNWLINFYSLITVLNFHQKKFVWFFDSYCDLYSDFENTTLSMPATELAQIKKIKLATPDPEMNNIGKLFADFLNLDCPNSRTAHGHYNELGHEFWAETVLIPYITERLTQ